MKRNKIIRRLGAAFALTGILSFGTLNSTTYSASAAVQSGDFYVDSITGDYAIINTSAYHLDCKNQGTVGKAIHLTTNIAGNASGVTYTYRDSYKCTGGRGGEVYGPYTSNSFTWVPKYGGLACLTVEATDANGVTKTGRLDIDLNDPLVIDSFTGEYNNGDFEVQEKVSLGQPVNLKASVSGGYRYGNKNYKYTVIPRNANPYNQSFTTTTQSPQFSWTPKYAGIYCVSLTVTDDIGNSASKNYYLMVK